MIFEFEEVNKAHNEKLQSKKSSIATKQDEGL